MAGKFWRCVWAPDDLNWWIGSLFALGSLLFMIGSVLTLSPGLARGCALTATGVNAVYFLGSIPFTTAAFLQLYQSANAPHRVPEDQNSAPRRRAIFGWQPHDLGWLSCALQFPGTVLFNVNTFDAMIPSLNWVQQDLVVWAPDLIGSILFLASGYLAFNETCHAFWAWNPSSLSWWVTLTNLWGCIGFMGAALFAIVLPGPANLEAAAAATIFTLLGAGCFFVGSCLMLPEAVAGATE